MTSYDVICIPRRFGLKVKVGRDLLCTVTHTLVHIILPLEREVPDTPQEVLDTPQRFLTVCVTGFLIEHIVIFRRSYRVCATFLCLDDPLGICRGRRRPREAVKTTEENLRGRVDVIRRDWCTTQVFRVVSY